MEQIDGNAAPLIVIYSQSEEIRLLLDAFLKIWNFRVSEAIGESDLIGIVERECPSLILFDVSRMFDEDLELLRRLRTRASFEKTPILVLSGHARAGNSVSALASGADEYFIKPLNFERLERSVKKYSLSENNTNYEFGGWQ